MRYMSFQLLGITASSVWRRIKKSLGRISRSLSAVLSSFCNRIIQTLIPTNDKPKKMSIGDVKTSGAKDSNYNWQLRMLQVASKCCTPVVTEAERLAIVNAPIGKLVYQTDGTEGLWVYKSTGWVYVG
jgi:hypothetical protein